MFQIGFCSEHPDQMEKCWSDGYAVLKKYRIEVAAEKYYDYDRFLKVLKNRGRFDAILVDGDYSEEMNREIVQASGDTPVFFWTDKPVPENSGYGRRVRWIGRESAIADVGAYVEERLQRCSMVMGSKLVLRQKSGIVLLDQTDIVYIERSVRESHIIIENGDSFYTRDTLNSLGERLTDRWLLRCHNSYFVNLRYVKAMERDCFLMRNGAEVPISRKYRNQSRDAFADWINT